MLQDDLIFGSILDSMSDALYVVDRRRQIVYWNRAAEELTGFRREDVMGRCCADNILCHVDATGRCLCNDQCPLAATCADGATRAVRVYLHHRQGHRVPVHVTAAPIRDEQQQIVGVVEVFSDDSAMEAARETIERLRRAALIDEMTQIPNRRHVEARLASRLEEWRRYGWPMGAFIADIDRFKRVNDTWGHAIGDRLLQAVAKVLSGTTRTIDTVGRWGGEEFVGIATHVDAAQLHILAERCRCMVEASFIELEGELVRPTVSIGIALAQEGDTAESLIARADAHLYEAKRSGRNCVRGLAPAPAVAMAS